MLLNLESVPFQCNIPWTFLNFTSAYWLLYYVSHRPTQIPSREIIYPITVSQSQMCSVWVTPCRFTPKETLESSSGVDCLATHGSLMLYFTVLTVIRFLHMSIQSSSFQFKSINFSPILSRDGEQIAPAPLQ